MIQQCSSVIQFSVKAIHYPYLQISPYNAPLESWYNVGTSKPSRTRQTIYQELERVLSRRYSLEQFPLTIKLHSCSHVLLFPIVYCWLPKVERNTSCSLPAALPPLLLFSFHCSYYSSQSSILFIRIVFQPATRVSKLTSKIFYRDVFLSGKIVRSWLLWSPRSYFKPDEPSLVLTTSPLSSLLHHCWSGTKRYSQPAVQSYSRHLPPVSKQAHFCLFNPRLAPPTRLPSAQVHSHSLLPENCSLCLPLFSIAAT